MGGPPFDVKFRRVATGDGGGAIEIWDVDSGEKLAATTDPKLGGDWINSMAFSPNGQYFAACGWGGVAVWLGRKFTTDEGANGRASFVSSCSSIIAPKRAIVNDVFFGSILKTGYR